MKFLIALALVAVAVAEPEADPQVYTTGLYNPYTYSSVYSPYTYGSYIKPAVYGGYGYGRIFKREAEAEPEADPALIYGSGLYNPYAYSSVYSPYTYGSYIKPAVYGGYGYGRIFKREAEAEPEADPALLYGSGLYSPYTYSGVYSPYTYGTYGSYIKPAVYGGYGYGRVFKREAESEPEADPALIYSNGVYNPYTYSGVYSPYTYGTYGSYIKPAVYGGYGYGRIFKREAEAEPEADPALLYGNGLYSPYAYSSIYRPYTYGSYIRPAVYGGLYY